MSIRTSDKYTAANLVSQRSPTSTGGGSINVGKTMSCLPAMTGNGNHRTYQNGDG